MPNEIPTLDFNDTFLDIDHLRASFPDHAIRVKTDDPKKLVPPFRCVSEEGNISISIYFCLQHCLSVNKAFIACELKFVQNRALALN